VTVHKVTDLTATGRPATGLIPRVPKATDLTVTAQPATGLLRLGRRAIDLPATDLTAATGLLHLAHKATVPKATDLTATVRPATGLMRHDLRATDRTAATGPLRLAPKATGLIHRARKVIDHTATGHKATGLIHRVLKAIGLTAIGLTATVRPATGLIHRVLKAIGLTAIVLTVTARPATVLVLVLAAIAAALADVPKATGLMVTGRRATAVLVQALGVQAVVPGLLLPACRMNCAIRSLNRAAILPPAMPLKRKSSATISANRKKKHPRRQMTVKTSIAT
jgi:hypothetical protein